MSEAAFKPVAVSSFNQDLLIPALLEPYSVCTPIITCLKTLRRKPYRRPSLALGSVIAVGIGTVHDQQ